LAIEKSNACTVLSLVKIWGTMKLFDSPNRKNNRHVIWTPRQRKGRNMVQEVNPLPLPACIVFPVSNLSAICTDGVLPLIVPLDLSASEIVATSNHLSLKKSENDLV
jgi:hypothetical protein